MEQQTGPQSKDQANPATHSELPIYQPDILPYDNNCNVYPSMLNLFNLCDSKTMLFLLGFFMTNAVPQLSKKKNLYSLAIISPTKEQAYVKKICDTLHRLVLNETKHPSIQFDVSQKIKYYFMKSAYSIPTITTTKEFNKEDSRKFSHALTEYYEHKPNKLKDSLIIIAKKEFDCNYMHKIAFNAKESPKTENAMKALKSDSFLCTTIKDFLENITNRYTRQESLLAYNADAAITDNAKLIKSKISKKIQELSNDSTLPYEDAIRYAPVVYFLEEYFAYLLQTLAITDEEYIQLCKKLKGVYSMDCDEVDDTSAGTSEPTPEEISKVLLSCVAEAYINNKIPDDTDGDFYIYKDCKKYNELICFKHKQSSPMKCIIDLIEISGSGDRISDIKEFSLQETVGESLKHLWKDSGITHTTDGLLYTTRNGKLIALIPERFNAYSKS